jgi:hypothetical protein
MIIITIIIIIAIIIIIIMIIIITMIIIIIIIIILTTTSFRPHTGSFGWRAPARLQVLQVSVFWFLGFSPWSDSL